MKKLIILIILIIIVGGFYFWKNQKNETVVMPKPSPITEEAKIPLKMKLHIGEEGEFLDVKITPLEVLEDSRCPKDVQCIQAGTVRVKATLGSGLGSSEQIFELNQSTSTKAEEITLLNVEPAPKSTAQIQNGEYIFYFEVKKK